MVDGTNASFYRAFEERYRGTRELIKSRLRVYLPFVEPFRGICGADKAVDLGCGRGEWLELLQESGFDAQGVDLDDGMLAACRERELKVHTGDAVAFLKGLPEASQAVVSGFHLAEHIPFADLQVLIAESLHALMPGGLLILETPNPENIVVGTSNFYIDPTHRQPIPSQLLSFLPEYYGFQKVKILRLQEPVKLSDGKVPTLFDVLIGVSPDYAVVAQKGAEPERMKLFDTAFEKNYGLSLETLASQYEARATSLTAHVAESESRARQTEFTLKTIAASVAESESRAWQTEMTLNSICNSRSWRITVPLRWLGRQARLLRDHVSARTKALVKKIAKLPKKIAKFVLWRCMRFVDAFPWLRHFCAILSRKVGVYTLLRKKYLRLTSQYNVPTAIDFGQIHTDDCDGTAPFSTQGTLTTDELLCRIRAELARVQEKGKEQ